MTGRLQGKVALVTGASRGIGRAIARRLAADGALVAVHYGASEAAARAVVADIAAAGGDAFLIQSDVTSVAEIGTMFAALDAGLAERGAAGLDILVNNAGIMVPGDAETTSEADFDRVFATNVKGVFFVTQHALPRLRDAGRIIHISSLVGHNAYPDIMAYAATKAAIDSLTLSMAQRLGSRRITVNAVAPGMTDTDFIGLVKSNPAILDHLRSQTAMGELGQPDDIANVVAFLASDEAGWITGERVRASGGMHL